ncbi:zinc finger protein CONSTANS-like [Cynara cardunculus var. scolymus]|uniref:B box-type domain-containing protein n=1 Tax=Cynara cardunculus var. scolymus TaxID=59895 RepID=A0A103XSB0_CYNCS|nr:zinc finger protein CONSTANS-like [Cynara cardunculus var. scolymus]KVH95944.1 hypothetical protein Ccrd_001975 [Cynara cardunculus var. scolymus]
MKSCELCKSLARIYCESDQASLCWSCDSKVHSANFLVARHSRSLLCRVCQSPTPWTASGEKLGPSTVSVCDKCVVDGTSEEDDDDREESQGGNDDDDEYDGDEDSENEIDLEDEEDGDDNQVVPLCCTPPPAASSSSSEEFSNSNRGVLVKRKRENVADLSSEDDVDCSSVQKRHHDASVAEATDEIGDNGAALHHSLPSSSEAIGEKLNIIRHRDKIHGENKSEAVVGVSKAMRAVGLDLNSSDS